jgi:endonuclease/exonuclease/phosphatase family metal-dependent hydrolase
VSTCSGGPIRRTLTPTLLGAALHAVGVLLGATAPLDAQAPVLRVAAYNIRHGEGMDRTLDLDRLAEVIRALDADVVTLQEVDRQTERTGRVDQVGVLAQRLGYSGFHGAHRPYQGGAYGNAVLTRLPVRATRTHAIPPASGSALAVHEVAVDVPGLGPVSVVSVHLAGSVEERLEQADSITSFFADATHPVILAGDFNGRPDDPAVERFAGVWRVLPKSGDPYTYPADAPDREIDFVMVRPPDAFELVEHRVVPEAVASDHRPLLATLRPRASR